MKQCEERIEKVHDEDKSLIEYAKFLHRKITEYDRLIKNYKMEEDRYQKFKERVD